MNQFIAGASGYLVTSGIYNYMMGGKRIDLSPGPFTIAMGVAGIFAFNIAKNSGFADTIPIAAISGGVPAVVLIFGITGMMPTHE